jgi:hypothetical protein
MDDDLEQLLDAIHKAAGQDRERNQNTIDGHLAASDQVIAHAAALKTISGDTTSILETIERLQADPA